MDQRDFDGKAEEYLSLAKQKIIDQKDAEIAALRERVRELEAENERLRVDVEKWIKIAGENQKSATQSAEYGERLREALEKIACPPNAISLCTPAPWEIAREALKES